MLVGKPVMICFWEIILAFNRRDCENL